MSNAFSISELRCVDMAIGQRLVVECESGPVEWRRLNRTNLAWAERQVLGLIGSGVELRAERAAIAFLWHLAAIVDGGPDGDIYEAFGRHDGDPVELFWQEWSQRNAVSRY